MLSQIIIKVLETLTILGALVATVILFMTIGDEKSSAVQLASGAATAIAFVVIPYCLASLAQRGSMRDDRRDEQ